LYKSGKTTTGVYTIDPDGLGAFAVLCDMETTPGRGWTIFQRRVDGSEDFYRNWTDYKTGFGNLPGEFWLGLDKIHRLSASGQNVLRIDIETFEDETAYAIYESFSVGNESEVYILNVGNYSGTDKYTYKFLECMYI
jgi:ficolin